jgi:hypothetical protein
LEDHGAAQALQVKRSAGATDLADQIDRTLAQVRGQICLIWGNGAENCQSMNATMQDNYPWAVADQVDRLSACWTRYQEVSKHG